MARLAPRFHFNLPPGATETLRRRLGRIEPGYGDSSPGTSASTDHPSRPNPCFACALFLEKELVREHARDATQRRSPVWNAFTRVLDVLVRTLQPPPRMLHVELLLVSATGECHHFATYVGDKATWRDRGADYYRVHQWRALPIDGTSGVTDMAHACDRADSSPYSLRRYVYATPILGWAARFLTERDRSPAQCAALTARIVRTALGERGHRLLPLPGARYSPSSLYNDLSNNAKFIDMGSFEADNKPLVEHAIETLKRGTDVEVDELGPILRSEALKQLACDMRSQLVEHGDRADPFDARMLAWVAVRVADLHAHSHRSLFGSVGSVGSVGSGRSVEKSLDGSSYSSDESGDDQGHPRSALLGRTSTRVSCERGLP